MASTRHAPLTLIVAMTAKNGIGKDNGLPWPMLKQEMGYFARVTQRLPPPTPTLSLIADNSSTAKSGAETRAGVRNVVIMGRKTWDGIPARFRPLRNRTNVVITRAPERFTTGINEDGVRDADQVIAATSIELALEELHRRLPETGRVFVIGGASIYDAAMRLDTVKRILLTRVGRRSGEEFECDTFFPIDVDSADSGWTEQGSGQLKEYTGEGFGGGDAAITEVVGNDTVHCHFKLYEKS